MKKTLRFAALAAVLSLTSWLTMEEQAQAGLPCSYLHGRACTGSPGSLYCGPEDSFLCICNGGYWDCGCVEDEDFGLQCPE